MKDYVKYIERGDLKGATHLEVSVRYSKGGMSYFTGKASPRGYYISVKPVTKKDNSVSFMLFDGVGQLVLEANRYSDKQFDRAVGLSRSVEPELIAAVLEKHAAA